MTTYAPDATKAIELCNRLLNPEDLGHAATPEIRDCARDALGLRRVETGSVTASLPTLNLTPAAVRAVARAHVRAAFRGEPGVARTKSMVRVDAVGRSDTSTVRNYILDNFDDLLHEVAHELDAESRN